MAAHSLNRSSNSVFQHRRKTKMEVLIPFSEDVGKRKTKMEV